MEFFPGGTALFGRVRLLNLNYFRFVANQIYQRTKKLSQMHNFWTNYRSSLLIKTPQNYLPLPGHMWQMRHRNPSELEQTCPCIFLNYFSITNNIWARNFFSIYGLLQKWFTSVFPYVMAKYRENWHFLCCELPEIV